ncbi:hypothetical protein PYCCODRAFT_1437493 [Trametes coccinea BRFM310]|uniref:Uncharacterized protein n=1 Tax=Trametes coccinea (strain BRFM310) TaxID=1353009 RepID=A0A1Y2IGS5_TRAC3|nr:hypothetical protein PYCCODRAFT_1437493 [Trametes coccinea BRFM310]
MQLARLAMTIAAAAFAMAGFAAAAPTSLRSDMPLPLRAMQKGVAPGAGRLPYVPMEYGL